MKYFLGIDAGGTKTACAVGDEERELGRGLGAASKLARVGEKGARDAVSEAVRAACAAAGIEPHAIAAVCVGAAGASQAEVVETFRKIVSEIAPAGAVEVIGDMVIAHAAAFRDGPGVIVISGTGSIAYGRNAAGETARAGGLGPPEGDEGSGEWIGRTAAMRIKEGKLANRVRKAARSKFSAQAPLVIAADRAGEAAAHQVLVDAGRNLAGLCAEIIARLWPKNGAVPVALAGGIFENSETVRETFAQELKRRVADAHVSANRVDPVAGALFRARRLAAAAGK